jgi:hypothetical protein
MRCLLTPALLAPPLLSMLVGLGGSQAIAADPCVGFKWDVRKEHALFSGPNVALAGGKNLSSAPRITADHLYLLQLAPQSEVSFVMPPGKQTLTDGYAGVAELKVEAPGKYRVSLDTSFWIDVVADGKLAVATDFQGQHGCDAPHKIVEFDLTGGTRFVVQLSGSAQPNVRLTVTRAP